MFVDDKDYKIKQRVTIVGTLVNVILAVVKYIFGVISGSSALIADATHSASDYVTDLAVLIGLKLSSRPADEDHPYGHGKYETMTTLIIGIAIVLAAGILFYDGIMALAAYFEGGTTTKDNYFWAIIAAVFSVASNEGLYHYTKYFGKKLKSSALLANAYHHRSDGLSSIAVLIGVLFAYFSPELAFMDPVAAIVVAFMVLKMAWEVLQSAFSELVDTVPDLQMLKDIRKLSNETLGVIETKKVRNRSIGNGIIVDMEICVDPSLSLFQAHDIAEEVKKGIKMQFDEVKETIVHVEPAENIAHNPTHSDLKLYNKLRNFISTYDLVKTINNIRFHYIPGGLEVNLDIVVDPNLTIQEGHDLTDKIEYSLSDEFKEVKLVHVHLECEKKVPSCHFSVDNTSITSS